MSHDLLDPTYNDELDPGHIMEKFSCSCGKWQRIYRLENALSLQEVQSEHEEHRHHAGAEELVNGTAYARLEEEALAPLETLVRAMAKFAEATFTAAEAMREFNEAHAAAQEKGIGVVIVRQQDGSVTSTPNVFVPAGTVIFMDMPGIALPLPPFKFPEGISEECMTPETSDPESSSSPKAA